MSDLKTQEQEAARTVARVIVDTFQGCPWHPNDKPLPNVTLVGHRDEPQVLVSVECPKCGIKKSYVPTEREVQTHYINRYTHNYPMALAVIDKLRTSWNRS